MPSPKKTPAVEPELIGGIFPMVDPAELFRKHQGPQVFGVSQTQIDQKIKQGEIPKPIKFFGVGRAVGWTGHQVNEHRKRIAELNRTQTEENARRRRLVEAAKKSEAA